MLRIVLVFGGFALTLYCLIDLWQTRLRETETLPRPAWVAIVALLPLVGPVAWLLFGRPAHDDESDDITLTRR
jgi:Phospholipase_D-nuclease N-terminal